MDILIPCRNFIADGERQILTCQYRERAGKVKDEDIQRKETTFNIELTPEHYTTLGDPGFYALADVKVTHSGSEQLFTNLSTGTEFLLHLLRDSGDSVIVMTGVSKGGGTDEIRIHVTIPRFGAALAKSIGLSI